MKYRYLQSYDLTNLANYCSHKCINVVINHHNADIKDIDYYRDLYLGYIYGKRVSSYVKRFRWQITNKELYLHFKSQTCSRKGINFALYDIMNYISDN